MMLSLLPRGTLPGRPRPIALPACLLLMCSLLPAESPAPTSPEPSIGLPTRERLTSLLGSTEQYSGSEIADWLVNDLFPLEVVPATREAFRQVAEQAAAEAVKPLLIELAGVRAERDAIARQLVPLRIAAMVGPPAALLLGVLLGLLLHPG
jgi:hypothetical protein